MSRKDKTTPQDTAPQANDLDQLRDILFGNQAQAISQQLTDLETRLEAARIEWEKNLNAQINKTAQTAAANLSRTEETLQEKFEQQISDLKQQLRSFQAETRRQHDTLRQEMLALGAMLDNQKTGRLELGQLLIQIGEQLQNNVRQTAVTEAAES